MPKSDHSMYDLDYLFAYLELPKIKNPLFRQKRTCNFEFEISGTCPDFHNKILKPFLNVDTIGCQKTTFESGILHFTKKTNYFFCKTFSAILSTFSFKKFLFYFGLQRKLSENLSKFKSFWSCETPLTNFYMHRQTQTHSHSWKEQSWNPDKSFFS